MKKRCFTCEYYGKCAVTQHICSDWSNKKPTKPSLDIMNFNMTWQFINYKSIWKLLSDCIKQESIRNALLNKHEKSFKKWYNRDWTIPLKDQIEVNDKFLSGRTIEEVVDESSDIAYKNSIEDL